MNKRQRKKLHKKYLNDVCIEVSTSSYWRKRVFESDYYQPIRVDRNDLTDFWNLIQREIKRHNLRFQVTKIPREEAFGWEDYQPDDFIFFKFQPVEFPKMCEISANNPRVI